MIRLLFFCFIYLSGFLSLSANPLDGFNKIARINELKKEAAKAYQNKDFAKAKQHYIALKDSFSVADDRILLNLANSYFHTDGKEQAEKLYTDLLASENKEIRSKASSQKGVMQFEKKELSKALISFKNALKNNPANEEARYNYELVKKMLEEDPNQDQQQNQDKNKDKDNKEENSEDQNSENSPNEEGGDKEDNPDGDSEESEGDQSESGDKQEGESGNKNQKDKENKEKQERGDQDKKDDEKAQDQEQQQEPGEEGKDQEQKMNEQQLKEMLEQMNMTEETAKSILEAMKNSDVQYIQQMRRKSPKKPDSSKPDW